MLSATSLYPATPEQTVVSRERAAAHWGQALTLEEFLEREAMGNNEEYGREGKLIIWYIYRLNSNICQVLTCMLKGTGSER